MPSLCLHKETRVSYEPNAAALITQLELPSTSTFSRTSRVTSKILEVPLIARDEEEFRRNNIASASSVFFRSTILHNEQKYPRAISWRCLENNTVLELRSVDVSKDARTTKDARHAIRITFPYGIQSSGIALADSAEDNVISVFIALKSNDLYTLSVKPSFFWNPAVATEDGDRWFKVARPSAFTAGPFHRLFALSSLSLIIASADGRLTKLARKQGEDGSMWEDTSYDEGEWNSSFRSLLPWQSRDTVRFEGTTLSQRTVHTATLSPDHQHVFTVSLDHYMKAWSVSTKKITCSRDLLGFPRTEDQANRYTLDPRTPNNLRVFESRSGHGTRYYAMTFSPYESGLFKIWIIDDADSEDGIRDAFEEASLRLPDPGDGALWTLSDYAIQSSANTTEISVWILLRLNRRYKLYTQRFDDFPGIGMEWGRGFTGAVVDALKHEPELEPPSAGYDHHDIVTKWMDFIARPDQPPAKVLETALATYTQGRQIKQTKASKAPLVERIATVVGSQAELPTTSPTVDDIEKLEQKLNIEWNHFWNVVKDLDHTRWEPLSLSLDNLTIMPWISFADGCAPIRQCSSIEILSHNQPNTLKRGIPTGLRQSIENTERISSPLILEQQALLIELGAQLRSSISEEMRHLSDSLIAEELWLEPRSTPSARMQDFAQACNMAEEIGERQQNEILYGFDSKKGPNVLTTRLFLSMIEHLSTAMARNSGQASTEFGVRTIVRGAQDMVVLNLRVLQDLLYLLIYLEAEVNRSNFPMKNLETEVIYIALLEQLRVAHLAHWLAMHTRSANGTRSDGNNKPIISSVLENLFAHDIKPQDDGIQTQSNTLTTSIRDLLTWCAGGNEIDLDQALVSIQCDLLHRGNIDLAVSFLRFQPRTAWSVYVQGRLCLLRHQYAEAASHFTMASYGVSRPHPSSSEYCMSSSGLLDPVTAGFLSTGLGNYYAHIVSLFAAASAPCHAYVMRFVRLALIQGPEEDEREDLLSRMFTSALALSQFEEAYAAIVRFHDRALQRSAVRDMAAAMVARGAVQELLGFAFPPALAKEVDTLLTEKAREDRGLLSAGTAGRDVPWFKVLYAWRVKRGDLRGAAGVLVERLEGAGKGRARLFSSSSDKSSATRLDEYLVAINALALVGDDEGDEGWVFVEREGGKRKVVRLKDLRDAYGEEMDRAGALEMGRYGIVGSVEEEEEEDDEDMDMDES